MLENPLDRSMTSCSRLMGLKEEFQGQTLKTKTTLRITLVGIKALYV